MSSPLIIEISTGTYSVTGDAVFDNHTYQTISSGGDPVWVRQDSGKVYYLNYQQQERLLYDFTLNVGDSFDVRNGPNYFSFLKVNSVDTVILGRTRKRMFLSCDDCGNYQSEIWIEGIGNINPTFYFPFERDFVFDGGEYRVLCYSENGALVYQNPAYNDCFYDTIIYLSDKNILEAEVRTYPNPVSDVLFVDLPSNEEVEVCLSSMLGVELFCEKHSGNMQIEMRQYPEGIYLLQIKSGKGSVAKRIVRER